MDSKYQIFVSSTFSDLKEERQVVSRSILELNHIPAGMELFPAFDLAQLDFIKRIIDDCDYYLLIIGGRYGSLGPDGVGYTEAEYDYAVEKNKPVIALLHEDVGKILNEKVEKDPESLKKLEAFRKKVSNGRLVKYWKDKNDLQSSAIISLTTSFNQIPQIGWIRNDGVVNQKSLKLLEEMRRRIDHQRGNIQSLTAKLTSFEELEESEIEVKYIANSEASLATVSADEIIREFAPSLKNGFNKTTAQEHILSLIKHKFDADATEIMMESVESVWLFFEVFEIAVEDAIGQLEILEDKLFLLKSAFKKRKSKEEQFRRPNLNDEIPF